MAEEVTRRNYRKKKGPSKGVRIIIWTVVFLLCFFVPFFIIYFGNSNEEPQLPTEVQDNTEQITPEARIYQLEQENEQLRLQIRDLETKLDEMSMQNAAIGNTNAENQGETTITNDRPADNNGWEELPTQVPEDTVSEPPAQEEAPSSEPVPDAPAEPEVESDPSFFGSNGL